MIVLQTYDGHHLNVSKDIAIKSEVIRQMLDDTDCADPIVPLQHPSCSLRNVEIILNRFLGAENEMQGLEPFVGCLDDMLSLIVAENFLEFTEILKILAKTKGSLHIVASGGYKDLVKVLLEAGADPNAQDHEGRCVLDVTTDPTCREEIEQAILLVEGWTRIMVSAKWGESNRIRALLEGSDERTVNEKNSLDSRAALHFAAERGQSDVILALIEGKAWIDIRDKVRHPTAA
jgi:ankyrin repeat protein